MDPSVSFPGDEFHEHFNECGGEGGGESVCMCVCVCVCERERERERERLQLTISLIEIFLFFSGGALLSESGGVLLSLL